jgi:hypothetical protein
LPSSATGRAHRWSCTAVTCSPRCRANATSPSTGLLPGIARLESADGEEPGALPCQLLDHGTGYLAAAAALDGLRRQASEGGTHVRRVSLARTAHWITSTPRPASVSPADENVDAQPWLQRIDGPDVTVGAVLPPGSIDGTQLQWSIVGRYGTNDPRFASTDTR